MELHIRERVLIPNIFPQNGKYSEYNLKKSILAKIVLSKEDIKEYNVKQLEGGQIQWDPSKDSEVPLIVEFTEDELNYMKSCSEKKSEENLADDMWDTIEKIYDATAEKAKK